MLRFVTGNISLRSRLPSRGSFVCTSLCKVNRGPVRAISDKKSDPLAQIEDKLASMQKYVDAGRKITSRQYEEVLSGARAHPAHWLQLIQKGTQGGYFDVRTSTQFLRTVADKKDLACAVGLAEIVAKKPEWMDAIFYRALVGTLLGLDAPQELVQQIILSRPDLDLGEHHTWQFYHKGAKGKIPTDLPTEIGLMYHLSNENNKQAVADQYKKLREAYPDYVPDLVTFTRIAHALGPPVNDWPLTWALAQSVMKSDAPRDVLFYNVILRALTYCNEPDDADLRIAQEVMEKLRADKLKPDKETYLALMDVYFRNGRGKQAADLLQMMTKDGVESDKVMLSRLVNELIAVNEPDMALDVLSKTNIPGTRQLYTYIEEAFVRDGNLDRAAEIRRMYREAKTRELGGELEKAVKNVKKEDKIHIRREGHIFVEKLWDMIIMKKSNVFPLAGAGGRAYPDADSVLGVMSITELYSEIMRMEARFGKFLDLRRTFELMVENNALENEDLDPFTAALYAFALGITKPERGLFSLLRNQKKIKPNHIIIHALLRGILSSVEFSPSGEKSPESQFLHKHLSDRPRRQYTQSEKMEIVEELEEFASERKIKLSKSTLDLLVEFYCENDPKKVVNYLLPKMQMQNVLDDRAYVSYVKSCGKNGPSHARQAIVDMGKIPSLAVHNVVLETYMSAGQCDEAVKYFGEMQSLFAAPNNETYEILVLGFIRNNRVSSALSIFGDLMHKASRFRPSATMVHALVQHLIQHSEQGQENGELIFRLLRDARGRHVMLTKETYESILNFVLSQPDYPPSDLMWILGHAKGDEVLIDENIQRAINERVGKGNESYVS